MKERISSALEPLLYWIGRRSMQSRLVAAYIAVFLLPSIVVSNYLFNQIHENYIEDALRKSQFTIELEKTQIQKQVDAMELAAQISISNRDVIDYLTLDREPGTSDLIDWNRGAFADFSLIQFNTPQIVHWRLFTDNPLVNEIWPTVFRESRIQTESWYKTVNELDGGPLWVFQKTDKDIMKRFTSEPTENEPKISLFREITEGRHIGIVDVEMLLKDFAPRVYTEITDNESQMLLADGRGELYLDSGQRLVGSDKAMRRKLGELLQGSLGSKGGEARFKLQGKSYLITVLPVERIDARLLNVVSLEGALDNISRSRSQIIAANVVLITLLSVITYFLNSFILKNLRRLTEAMKRVRKGEFHTPIPRIQGSGEVGELAHHFNKLIQTINELIAQGIRKQALTKEAELRTLHNQIDSHFLYNTLENIKMLAEMEGQRAISDALTSLGGMMRYNFKWSGEYVKLRDELRHIENYTEVMNIRFDEPIVLKVEVPEPFLELEVLKMSLQPIVENAVKHAWTGEEQEEREIGIRVAEWGDGDVRISVTDNGQGLEPEALARLNAALGSAGARVKVPGSFGPEPKDRGIGLRNVQERVRMFFGLHYGLEVFSERGEYTSVVMIIPKALLTGGGGKDG
ncbi:sensor histidine kinase [Paenibacillus sanfengchensis]|uniref:cache domain-containing sensor histidine kinase n=1 Tax=Paenibacillus sanfengchensis TaxID=3119819 RepID=UPI002FE38F60